MKEIHGRPPTSHFHVLVEYDSILSTLELNFFITKYYQMKDRDGKKVSIYALNYGLCQQQAISFSRPREKRVHRLYFVERIFDYSPIISSYIKMNQEISCDNCGEKFAHDKLSVLQVYDMLCPKCRNGICRVINLSRKYEKVLREIDSENLLPQTELGILKTLHDEREKLFAKQIASELDCSYQLVGKRGKKLSDKMLVVRSRNERGRREFEISDTAKQIYFQEIPEDNLNFGEEPELEDLSPSS
jgi:DNA-binding MarR family transcriptional regulator